MESGWQASENGFIVLPYSPSGKPCSVSMIGSCRILPFGRTVEVDESDIVNG